MDLVGRRERYLKSNFESLSGAEDAGHNNNASISNQFREGGGASALQRNARTIARWEGGKSVLGNDTNLILKNQGPRAFATTSRTGGERSCRGG